VTLAFRPANNGWFGPHPLGPGRFYRKLSTRLDLDTRPKLFITLTFDPHGLEPKAVWRRSCRHAQFNAFIRRLRAHCPPFEWVRKLEFTAAGYPHYHMILLGIDFIAADLLRALWSQGAVYIELCNNDVAQYISKYLAKFEMPEYLLE